MILVTHWRIGNDGQQFIVDEYKSTAATTDEALAEAHATIGTVVGDFFVARDE